MWAPPDVGSSIEDLTTRLDEMQEEIDALRAHSDGLAELINSDDKPSIQYVRELHPQGPISEPLDVQDLALGVFYRYSFYDELGDVYSPGMYL